MTTRWLRAVPLALGIATASIPGLAQEKEPAADAAAGATATPAAPSSSSAPKPRAPAARAPDPIDELTDPRGTPRRALTGFLRAAEARDGERAAGYLDLRGVPLVRRAREGVELAMMLHRVLTWSVVLVPEAVPDVPDADGASTYVIDTLHVDGEPVPIVLERTRAATGSRSWKFSQATVAQIRPLYEAQDRRGLEQEMPEVLRGSSLWGLALWQWLGLLVLVVGVWVGARLGSAVIVPILGRVAGRLGPKYLAEGVRSATRPLTLAIAVFAFRQLLPYLALSASASLVASRAQTILLALATGWMLVALVRSGTRAAAAAPEAVADEPAHRGMRTRLLMIERVATAVIAVLSLGVMLMQFEVVRTVGVSLLASAGVAGVVLGFAAQRTLGGVIGGIELAFTQPLRIGDTVVIDGEFGVVEEMFFTYVSVRCWDGRRLIVPVTRLLAQPFENWTRRSPEMLVSVDVRADFRVPVHRVREEFVRACEAHPLWDKRLAKLVVRDTSERTLQLRGLASIADGLAGVDLKDDLREHLLRFLQELEGGAYLPRERFESFADEPPTKPEPSKPEPSPKAPAPKI
jgi:small-conductance mechanosensitive channel